MGRLSAPVAALRRARLAARVAPTIALLHALATSPARAQEKPEPAFTGRFAGVEVAEPGPGRAGRLLRAALAQPHVAWTTNQPAMVLPRDTTFEQGIVVYDADLYLGSVVRGDVVVVGGDLHLRPGAAVLGRAIAYGGGVYTSTFARAEGGTHAFLDATFRGAPREGILVLRYERLRPARERIVELPAAYGLRLPTYTRVDGLSLSWGPLARFGGGLVEVDPTVTYRSHLGVLDPAFRVAVQGEGPLRLEVSAGRGTYTNDAWMRGDLVNSAATLLFGDDARNYFRATRAELLGTAELTRGGAYLTPGLGARTEESSSLGPAPGSRSAPWAGWGGTDTTRMLRPNPPVTGGRITSALGSLAAGWEAGDLQVAGEALVEVPISVSRGDRFVQVTLDGSAGFRTTGTQRLDVRGHLILTGGDAPSQRWGYLGGGSTLATADELALGGDRLLFLEGVYSIPLRRPALPLLGAPTVGVRYAVGSAGVGSLPALTQNVGARLQLSLIRLDLMVDPATGDRAVGVGTTFFR